MNQLFQVVSSIASIFGIPLAIYLYLRAKDNKFDKIRSEIIKTILYQIGEGRKLEEFEISSVIKSKLRAENFKENKIESKRKS